VRLLRLTVLAAAAGSLLVGCADGQSAPDAATASPAPSPAERTGESALVDRLRRGGYVIYFRHAATGTVQDDPSPDLSDPGTQRNLSDEGRAQARTIGEGVRRLRIPIGQVLASPYNRTRETAALAFGTDRVRTTRELISEGFPGTDDDALARNLRRLLGQRPGAGTNTVLVSHGFNLNGATGLTAGEGEAVIFDPGGRDPLQPAGRIAPDDWRRLQ
jgi:phosphohistidine phosphatase SixA